VCVPLVIPSGSLVATSTALAASVIRLGPGDGLGLTGKTWESHVDELIHIVVCANFFVFSHQLDDGAAAVPLSRPDHYVIFSL
jgi:hypothetical protein